MKDESDDDDEEEAADMEGINVFVLSWVLCWHVFIEYEEKGLGEIEDDPVRNVMDEHLMAISCGQSVAYRAEAGVSIISRTLWGGSE